MREFWTTDGAVRTFGVESGEGAALLFLHGGLADHRAVLPIVGPLTDRFRVITPDLRGSGRSWYAQDLGFEQLSDDLLRVLDHLGVETAFVGGVSSGSGPALRFALRWPERTRGFVAMHPVYAGRAVGYTEEQVAAFSGMDAVARRAPDEGVEVLRAMYFGRLPAAVAERAWGMAASFDPGSVAATSRFVASGLQPFDTRAELEAMRRPSLLIRADDPVHPASVSELYARSLPNVTEVPAGDPAPGIAIGTFMDRVTAASDSG